MFRPSTFSLGITRSLIGDARFKFARKAISDYNASAPRELFPGFKFWPSFFSFDEQKCLLDAALTKLDSMESRRSRQRRRQHPRVINTSGSIQQMFYPDDCYEFQEGHFDGVIRRYREMHLSSWSDNDVPGLSLALQRLYSLCPTSCIQTHLLHLASDGEILPHIDNVSASGVWILGASFGEERILTLDNKSTDYEIALPSGSVYLQSDHIRYTFRHSIKGSRNDENHTTRQRLSIMVRVSFRKLFPCSFDHYPIILLSKDLPSYSANSGSMS
ncbi:hypothetical protein BDQ17DRAFT_1244136 [Cyathus striatus]|nr:hypothetical protein BDQ17DRAFT_1244136 [Cyathus striatus]